MIKKIIEFFGLSKHQKNQESQERSTNQQLVSQVLLSKSKPQSEIDSKFASFRERSVVQSSRCSNFLFFGFHGFDFRNRHSQ